MPYKLRKAPNKPLYWVVTIETGKKHSKDPIPMDKAKAQMRVLESALQGNGKVYLQKLGQLRNEHTENEAKIKREHAKMLKYAQDEDVDMLDVLSLPIGKKYKSAISERERIKKDFQYWRSIQLKEEQASIQEVEEEPEVERPPGTEAAKSGLSAIRMLRKKKGGIGWIDKNYGASNAFINTTLTIQCEAANRNPNDISCKALQNRLGVEGPKNEPPPPPPQASSGLKPVNLSPQEKQILTSIGLSPAPGSNETQQQNFYDTLAAIYSYPQGLSINFYPAAPYLGITLEKVNKIPFSMYETLIINRRGKGKCNCKQGSAKKLIPKLPQKPGAKLSAAERIKKSYYENYQKFKDQRRNLRKLKDEYYNAKTDAHKNNIKPKIRKIIDKYFYPTKRDLEQTIREAEADGDNPERITINKLFLETLISEIDDALYVFA